MGNDMKKKPIVEIIADHGVPFSARLNIHRQEHITRVIARALEDGDRGSFVHFLQQRVKIDNGRTTVFLQLIREGFPAFYSFPEKVHF